MVLGNSYERRYFLSADRSFRLTVDSDLQFYRLSSHSENLLNASRRFYQTIAELKYDWGQTTSANRITNHFPIRMTRSSKYQIGMQLLYG